MTGRSERQAMGLSYNMWDRSMTGRQKRQAMGLSYFLRRSGGML
jgi:hypothetical protein